MILSVSPSAAQRQILAMFAKRPYINQPKNVDWILPRRNLVSWITQLVGSSSPGSSCQLEPALVGKVLESR